MVGKEPWSEAKLKSLKLSGILGTALKMKEDDHLMTHFPFNEYLDNLTQNFKIAFIPCFDP